MAIQWDSSKCAAREAAVKFDEDSIEWKEHCITQDSLIWALVYVGFPSKSPWEITEDNWEELYRRIHMHERVSGAYRFGFTPNVNEDGTMEKIDHYFTPAEIYSFIGFKVNAGNKSTSEFQSKVRNAAFADADRFIREFEKKAA